MLAPDPSRPQKTDADRQAASPVPLHGAPIYICRAPLGAVSQVPGIPYPSTPHVPVSPVPVPVVPVPVVPLATHGWWARRRLLSVLKQPELVSGGGRSRRRSALRVYPAPNTFSSRKQPVSSICGSGPVSAHTTASTFRGQQTDHHGQTRQLCKRE